MDGHVGPDGVNRKAGKLASTDGIYGLRFAHNTEVIVTGFEMKKN